MWKTLLTIGLGSESITFETLNFYHARWMAKRWNKLTHRKGGYLIVTQWQSQEKPC